MSQLTTASRNLAATLLLLLTAVAEAAAATAEAPAVGAACYSDLVALRSTCYGYVEEGGPAMPPSPACCATVIGVCNYLGTDFYIDQDKVFYVARPCGVTIPSSCGDE